MIRIYFSCVYLCVILSGNCNGDSVMEDVLVTLEKAIVFYSLNYADMNIDGIFGLRVIEGQLGLMLSHLKSKKPLDDGLQKVYKRLNDAYHEAKRISDSSLKVLKEMDSHYFEVMNRVIRRPWSFARNYLRIDPTLKWQNTSVPSGLLDEKKSDNCMNELLGGPTHTPCSISTDCVTDMSARGMDGYGITHQLLYTMLAEQSDCLEKLNMKFSELPNKLTVEQLQVEFCANNFFQTRDTITKLNGVIGFEIQDLFLEQELVCPMLGYAEFLHIDWLRQIISWQMPQGCYGDNSDQLKFLKREQHVAGAVGSNGGDLGQQPNELLFLRPTPTGKSVTELRQLTNVVPVPAGRNPRDEFVGLNSNARKSGYNDSKVRRGVPVMGMNPMDKERGKLGKQQIKLDIQGDSLDQAVGEQSHEQGRVGDTRVRVDGNMGNSDFQKVGNIWKRVMPFKQASSGGGGGGGGGGGNNDKQPDEDNFRINRQINRKLLYEKPLKDGCLAHKTAVAMGALSQYLRFLIFANSSGFDAIKHLFGINHLMNKEDSLLPSVSPTAPDSIKKNPLLFVRSAEPPVVKSSVNIKIWDDVDKDRPGFVRHVERFKMRVTSGLKHPVITTTHPFDDKYADYDTLRNVDKRKKDRKSEADFYDEGGVNDDVPMGTDHPVVKSHEDDLLLYNELVADKPKVVTAVLDNRLMAKASHMHSSGDSSFEGVSSIGSTYAFVIVVTIVILFVLYRSLRKHRIGFQHRHVRWK